jgi:two-component system nitrate/nitrite response regulator NarL
MDSDFKMVGNAIDGAQGIELALQLEPHLVLLDINMAGMDGMAVLTELKRQNFSGLIIMLTVSADTQDITLALQQGADGYLLKDMQPEDILRKLRYAINHQPVTVLDATIANTLVEMLRNEGMVPSMARVSFSDREQEVITCIAEGKSNKLIARSMDISEGTVKVYVKNILRKLNLSSRLEAAIWAVDHGY